MNKYIIPIPALALILLFSYSCKNSNNNPVINNTQNIVTNDTIIKTAKDSFAITPYYSSYIAFDKYAPDTLTFSNISGFKQLSLKFNVDSTGNWLKNIKVYADNRLIQSIKVNEFISYKKFELIDWNFDGYKDISVNYSCGSGGCQYYIWNYSKNNKKFYYNKELSEMLGLYIDTANKYIINHYRAGYVEENWDTLVYQNNKLKFVKGLYVERFNDSTGKTWIKNTRTRLINHKLITISDSSIIKNKYLKSANKF